MRHLMGWASVALLAASASMASEPQSSKDKQTEAEAKMGAAAVEKPVVESGVRVYVDPETGRRTSKPASGQRGALSNSDEAAVGGHEQFTTETLPSGAIMLHTNGGGQSVVMARVGADGKAVIECDDATHRTLGNHNHAQAQATAREEF
jgi:hypothetical protein